MKAVESKLLPGTLVGGRYVIEALIGSGGMGEVYRADDDQLKRTVAIKVLHGKTGGGDEESRGRLLREAQAIAQLRHPNVVVVYDVGAIDDRAFLAMEYVDGQNLSYWQHAATPDGSKRSVRPWREVLQVMIAAGRGLAAAHRIGIIHRDVKPANLMLDSTGVVRLMDFGLARQLEGKTKTPTPKPTRSKSQDSPLPELVETEVDVHATAIVRPAGSLPSVRTLDDGRLTETGAMIGTPLYMAPEQHAGQDVDELSDQYAFCASLYELLYGVPPFLGKSLGETVNAKLKGECSPPPPATQVPARIRRILLQGLASLPSDRHPSMDALLAALEHDPVAKQRQRLVWCSMVLIVIGAGLAVLRASESNRRIPCLGGADRWAGVWEPGLGQSARKKTVAAAFAATGKPYAAKAFETVASFLDRYTAKWSNIYTESCQATSVRGEQSPEVLDLRTGCLQDRLMSAKALTDIFTKADGLVVENAAKAVQALPALDRCSDVAALRALVKPPDDPAVLDGVQTIRPELARVKALSDAGHISDALKLAGPIAKKAARIGYLPLLAEAQGRLAALSFDQPAKAEALYSDAIWASQAGGDDELLAEQSILQSYVIGYLLGETTRARPLLRTADAILHRLGGHDLLRAWMRNNEGALFFVDGNYDESAAAFRVALQLKEKVLGPNDSDVGQTLGNLANPLARLGRLKEALAVTDRAIDLYERTVGSTHPDLAMHLCTRADVLVALGRYDDAEAAGRRALEIWSRELAPDHLFLGYPLTVIGTSYLGRGRTKEAEAVLERAYSIRTTARAEPSLLGETAFALARALQEMPGKSGRGMALAQQARELFEKARMKDKGNEVQIWILHHNERGLQDPAGEHPDVKAEPKRGPARAPRPV